VTCDYPGQVLQTVTETASVHDSDRIRQDAMGSGQPWSGQSASRCWLIRCCEAQDSPRLRALLVLDLIGTSSPDFPTPRYSTEGVNAFKYMYPKCTICTEAALEDAQIESRRRQKRMVQRVR
jgi:hypothetical protein